MTPKPATAARRDSNEAEIVDTFRKLGWSVWCREGPLDLIISKGSRTVLIEVKDGSKVPSRQKLTDAERDFIRGWRGEVYLVRSVEDAKIAVGYYRKKHHPGRIVLWSSEGWYRRLEEMRDEIRAIQAEPKP